jgi:hypothetical protein
MKIIKNFAFGAILLAATGCSAKPMGVQVGESIVSLQSQIGDEMSARHLNGQRVARLNNFKVSAGRHEMEVGIIKMDYLQSHRRCIAMLAYADFLPGQHYKLIKRSSGKDV